MPPSTDLLQGTLDLLIVKTLALEPMHGWGVAQRIQQISKEVRFAVLRVGIIVAVLCSPDFVPITNMGSPSERNATAMKFFT